MENLNPIFNDIANDQGIEVGSQDWKDGGGMPMSGTTGPHGSYGFRHDHKLTNPKYPRMVFANYGHRRCHYLNAPDRTAGYERAGRPVVWSPELPGDLPNGMVEYKTSAGVVKISAGLDFQHFWADPLFALMDSGAKYSVTWNGKPYPAGWLARLMAEHHIAALAGQIRHLFPYVEGGRGTARIIDTFVQAGKRGLVSGPDADLIVKWVEQEALPQLERAPGVANVKGSGYCNIYQEIGWMLLPLHEAVKALASWPNLAARVVAVLKTKSQWMLDIDAVDGRGASIEQLKINPAILAGKNGKTLPTLAGVITAADFKQPYDYTIWSTCATDIVRIYAPGPQAEAFHTRTKAKALKMAKPHDKGFLVDRDRNWLS